MKIVINLFSNLKKFEMTAKIYLMKILILIYSVQISIEKQISNLKIIKQLKKWELIIIFY